MTDAETLLLQAKTLVEVWVQEANAPEPNRLDVWVAAADLTQAVEALLTNEWGYLVSITGLDPGAETGELEVLYHFCEWAAVFGLRVRLPREAASVPTVCDLIPSASMFERELMEMFGVEVIGTPDDARLFLPDDWTDGEYPLRKDYVYPKEAES